MLEESLKKLTKLILKHGINRKNNTLKDKCVSFPTLYGESRRFHFLEYTIPE